MLKQLLKSVFTSKGERFSEQLNGRNRHITRTIENDISLGYMKLEPRRVLAVGLAFNAGTGELDITLDAANDSATIDHNGTNVTVNGSEDLDTTTAGVQTLALTDLKIIDIDGAAGKANQSVIFNGTFNNASAPNLQTITADGIETVTFNGTYELANDLTINLANTGSGITDGATGSLTVAGTTTFNAAANVITLDNNSAHDFQGTVALENTGATNNISIEDLNSIELGNISTDGDLNVTSGAAITDADDAKIEVGDEANFTATTTITLGDDGNGNGNGTNAANTDVLFVLNQATFSGTVISIGQDGKAAGSATEGANVNFGTINFNSSGGFSILEDSNTRIIGNNSALSLEVVSAGLIADSDDSKIVITNDASFTANNSIVLADDPNANGTGTGTSTDILSIGGTATFDGATVKIGQDGQTAGSNTNGANVNFAKVNFNSGGAVLIREDSSTGVIIDGTNTANNLVLETAGAISNADSASITVANSASFHNFASAANDSISIGNATGDNYKAGTTTFNSQGAVTIYEDDATDFSGTSTAASLDSKALGHIENEDNSSITVTNNASFDNTDVTDYISIGNATSDNYKAGTTTFNSKGAVTVYEDDASDFAGTNTAASLDSKAQGHIENEDNSSITITNNASFDNSDVTDYISIGNATSDNYKAGTTTFNSKGAVTIYEDDASDFAGTNTAASLVSKAEGHIENEDNSSITITNNASFENTGVTDYISIGNANLDNYKAGTTTFNSKGAVTVYEDDASDFAGTNTAASLDSKAQGHIENEDNSSITITNNASFDNSDVTDYISIGNATSDNYKAGTTTFNSKGAVTIYEDDASDFAGTNTAASLVSKAEGHIENEDNSSITITNNASFENTGVTDYISIGNANLDNYKAGTTTFNSKGAVIVYEDDATDFSGTNTAASLVSKALGHIENENNSSITITNNASFENTGVTDYISIGNAASDNYKVGTTTFNSKGAVTVYEDDASDFAGTNTAASLDSKAQGHIENEDNSSITITNNASFDNSDVTDYISIGNATSDNYNAGTTTFNSKGAVTIYEDDASDFAGTNTAASLDSKAEGHIENEDNSSITVTNNASFDNTGVTDYISIGNANLDTYKAGTTTFNSKGAVTIYEDDATEFAGTNTAGSLDSKAVGAITDAEDVTIDVGADASFTADGEIVLADNDDDDVGNDRLAVVGQASFITTGAEEIRVGIDKNYDAFDCDTYLNDSDSGAVVNFGKIFFDSSNGANTVYGKVSFNEDSTTTIVATSKASELYIATTSVINDAMYMNVELANAPVGEETNLYLETTQSISLGQAGGSIVVSGIAGFRAGGTIDIGSGGGTVDLNQVVFNSGDASLSNPDDVTIVNGDALTIIWNNLADNLSVTATKAGDTAISDGEDAKIVVESNADFVATNGNIVLADDPNANGTGATTTTDILSVVGDATFKADNISVGIDGNNAGNTTNGANVRFGILNFNSTGEVKIGEDDATGIVGNNSGGSLALESGGNITDADDTNIVIVGDASFVSNNGDTLNVGDITLADDPDGKGKGLVTTTDILSVGGVASFTGGSINIGQDNELAGAPMDGANVMFGSLNFNSGGDVNVREDDHTVLTGTSSAMNLDLDSGGNITDTKSSELTVEDIARFDANQGLSNIALGDEDAKVSFGHKSANTVEFVELNANNAYLEIDSNMNLGETAIGGTLFVEGVGIDDDNNNVSQVGGLVSATNAAFNLTGALQLTNAKIGLLAIETDGQSGPFTTFTPNATAQTNLLNQNVYGNLNLGNLDYGVIVEAFSETKIGTVVDPLGIGTTISGVMANQGSIYLETHVANNLVVSENIHAVDGTQNITVIAGGDFQLINSAQLTRGSAMDPGNYGVVNTDQVPFVVILDPTGVAGDQYRIVKYVDGRAFVEYGFGLEGAVGFTTEIAWAEGIGGPNYYYGFAQTGADAPMGGFVSTVEKGIPFTLNFLLDNPTFMNTMTVFNDFRINIFENGGSTDLNQNSVQFTQENEGAGVGVIVAPVIEFPEPVSQPLEREETTQESNYNDPEEFDEIRPSVYQEPYAFSVLLGSAETEEIRAESTELEDIVAEIENNDLKYGDGTYEIFRVSPNGTKTLLGTHTKGASGPLSDNSVPIRPVVHSEAEQLDPEEQEKQDQSVWRSQWKKWVENGNYPDIPGENGNSPDEMPMPEFQPEFNPAAAVAQVDDIDLSVNEPADLLETNETQASAANRLATQIASGAMLGGAMMIASRRLNQSQAGSPNSETKIEASTTEDQLSFSKSARRKRKMKRKSNL